MKTVLTFEELSPRHRALAIALSAKYVLNMIDYTSPSVSDYHKFMQIPEYYSDLAKCFKMIAEYHYSIGKPKRPVYKFENLDDKCFNRKMFSDLVLRMANDCLYLDMHKNVTVRKLIALEKNDISG